MHYFGGKWRIAHHIADYLNRYNPGVYLEPFAGMCNVGLLVDAPVRIFSDNNPYVIAMWRALYDGWEPPDHVSEADYGRLKTGDGSAHLVGFAGVACSFSGKWFGGYARDTRGRDYAKDGKNSLAAIRKYLKRGHVEFHCWEYDDAIVHARADVVYCDPPYKSTSQDYFVRQFDSGRFWQTLRDMRLPTAFVSEYAAPPGFVEVFSTRVVTDMRTRAGREVRYEKLYGVEGQDYLADYDNPALDTLWKVVK